MLFKLSVRNFTCFSANIRSLLAISDVNIPSVELLHEYCTKTHDIDVVALTEMHLNCNILNDELKLDNYNILRKDRPVNGRYGGGVLMYMRSCFNAVEMDIVGNNNIGNSIESIFCRFTLNSKCYRGSNIS